MITRLVTFVTILVALTALPAQAQERFSFFQASTPESVERMLTLAGLRDDDLVLDLGSGNGLIPLTAARMNPRLRGRGVDIDANLVDESNQQARREGLADRVRFEHRNAFDADLREATVVTMWLFPELMRLLRPVILERARPGTRVLTSTWDLGSWQPDKVSQDVTPVFMWIVPARVAGGWDWDLSMAGRQYRYASVLEQRFQVVEGVARAGDRREVLEGVTLRGDDIAFKLNITLEGLGLTQHEFSGKVSDGQIVGTVKVTPSNQGTISLDWRARRVERSDYFAPTGTAVARPLDQIRILNNHLAGTQGLLRELKRQERRK
jgi:SAM-dependent methyltransferase